jgi:hypothetical protein
MSSRLTRTLLKLYPRRIRNRYGDELLGLQDELRAQGDVSRVRLIRDMLAGALLVRPARTYLLIGAVLVIGGLAVGGAIIGERGTDSPARASRPQARLTVLSAVATPPACFVADGSSCSLTPCSEFIVQPSVETAVADRSLPATRSRPRVIATPVTATRCAAYPHARSRRPVYVSG